MVNENSKIDKLEKSKEKTYKFTDKVWLNRKCKQLGFKKDSILISELEAEVRTN